MPTYDEFLNRVVTTGKNYAYLKIGEGCSNKCTYCAIPYIRGPFVSRKMEDILEEAEKLASEGIKEIIVIAQDTTKYGEDIYGKSRLAELLQEISKIDGIEWIRFLYSYPEGITGELIDTVANNPKIAKYFDIPIQHISNVVLKRMNRKTLKEKMMKHNNLFLWLLGLTVCWLASCSEEDGRVTYPYSCPEISELQFSTTDQTPAADSLYFSVKIHDPQTPLSTLEVKLMTGETLVSSQSIRTKGTDVSIVEKGIYIPFEAGLEENQEAKVILTAINVEGSEVTQTFDFHITRPQIPEVLYLHYNGEVVEMTRSEDNPYLYLTEVF